MTCNIEQRVLLLLSFLALTAFGPGVGSMLHAQGNQFYSCTDRDGNTVITNRLYDSAAFECVPFAALNKVFKEDEALRGKRVPERSQISGEKELTANAQAAQLSAESARIAMEAAHASAVAAQITAEAVRTALQPDFIIITPHSSVSVLDRRFFTPVSP